MNDPVKKPNHYNWHPSGVECKTIAEAFTFNLGNAIKYIWRAGHKSKETEIEDLKKAREFIDFEIQRLEKQGPIGKGVILDDAMVAVIQRASSVIQ